VSLSSLPLADRPDPNDGDRDRLLRRQLEASLRKHFYESCHGVTQGLLTSGEWCLTNTGASLMLVLHCPDQSTHWRILNNISHFAAQLAAFSRNASIQISPPPGMGDPQLLQVHEIAVHSPPKSPNTGGI
jgi:hypothetical protein